MEMTKSNVSWRTEGDGRYSIGQILECSSAK